VALEISTDLQEHSRALHRHFCSSTSMRGQAHGRTIRARADIADCSRAGRVPLCRRGSLGDSEAL
jgi:hypothetical protein